MGCMWFVLSDLSDFCDFCVCDELVICVVSLGTGRVPHPASTRKPQPSLLQVLVGKKDFLAVTDQLLIPIGNQKLISDSQKVFFERIGQGRTSLGKQSLGRSSQERKYPARPSSISSIHWRPQRSWLRTPESQDTSLRSPLQNVACPNTPRKIHPKIPQWMFMLESLFCFLNPFTSFLNLFNVQKVQKKLKSQNWNKLSKTPRASLPHQSQSAWLPTKGSQPGGTSCSAWCLCAQ